MNYLAHLYLSGESEKRLVGNFIGDYVKGNKYKNYPNEISEGIILHRQIDSFTDAHDSHRIARDLFRDDFGLYSGIVVDFIYDHFLAKKWTNYSSVTLRTFAKKAHAILLSHFTLLPSRVQGFLPFLIQNKRLESYASVDGIIHSLRIMSNYSTVPKKSEEAKVILTENYQLLDNNFSEFMADMIDFTERKINESLFIEEQNLSQ